MVIELESWSKAHPTSFELVICLPPLLSACAPPLLSHLYPEIIPICVCFPRLVEVNLVEVEFFYVVANAGYRGLSGGGISAGGA